jgi:hypothetical protein
MDEYLTTLELSRRIKMAPGTIRNLVWKRELKENVHYLKPTPRKLLFVWSEIQDWLHHGSCENRSRPSSQASLINI